jgi:hypothetical protein
MNFDPVGVDKNGEYYMKYHIPLTTVEKIQLLQRWILVQSFAYYELNQNIASDFEYDENAKQLSEFAKTNPDEFKRSKYYEYFHDYCQDDIHYTSGFDLLDRLRKSDPEMYRRVWMDAVWALELKEKYGLGGIVK